MMRKAMPFPFRSACWEGINSKMVNKVLVDRQQNTQKRAKDKKMPAMTAVHIPLEAR